MGKLLERCLKLLKNENYTEIERLLGAYGICAIHNVVDAAELKQTNLELILYGTSLAEGLTDSTRKKAAINWVFTEIIVSWPLLNSLKNEHKDKIKLFLLSVDNGLEGFYQHAIKHIFEKKFNKLDECVNYFGESETPAFEATLEKIVDAAITIFSLRTNDSSPELRLWIYQTIKTLKTIFSHERYERFIKLYEDDVTDNKAIDPNNPGKYYTEPDKTYKNRLFVGEGNFSYTRALLIKHKNNHPTLGNSITATEYLPQSELENVYIDCINDTFIFLNEHGVVVIASVDAQRIGEMFSGRKFPRIHFNFPHDRKSYEGQTLPKIIGNFFASAKKLQNDGDRIHMALSVENEDFRQSYIYGIYETSARSGYKLVKRRRFDKSRYPDYQHTKTGDKETVSAAKEAREFIFEKTNYSYNDLIQLVPPRRHFVHGKPYLCLPKLDTDDDSSDYEIDHKSYKAT